MISFSEFEKLFESEIDNSLPEYVKKLVSSLSQDADVYVEPWYENIMKRGVDRVMKGIRMYVDDLLFRINWKNKNDDDITIDVWTKKGDTKESPEWTIHGDAESFALMPDLILDVIHNLSVGKKVETMGAMTEAIKLTPNTPKITPADPENIIDPAQEQDPSLEGLNVLSDLRSMLMLVIDNINPSLVICGRGGVGKTHTVTTTFEEFNLEEGKEYVIIKGASSALSMYKALYYNNGKIIVFDDCDSIFRDEDGVNILKAALDSYSKRNISWLSRSTFDPRTETPTKTKQVPNMFEFDGSIVFISNLPAEKIDEAVRTRSYVVDVTLNEKQIITLIENNIEEILPTVSVAIKREVLDYMKKSYSTKHGEMINYRTFIKAVKIRMTGHPDWKKLVNRYA